ncbi:hypothetical protein MVES1_001684 [Malassezia vespertilionis]|uniref:Uncharacterized protein n=1 Tax=Malassezia vespertilionis TaxID=2020962 RepID=A0A2N1JDF8_9BASI|nr:uncharacterized protein MVES1_001684 [Malassezia vespertilionis]PKI84562.1 hypothetical protein MVES_001585 [Malassezia vespertilionis]WFD06339.1 hypothetical protein MVES1_001684 [Malassezia vespertilionis]
MPASPPVAFLTLVRHAQSEANAQRVLQGITDAPLSRNGVQQVQRLEAAWRPCDEAANSFGLPQPHLIVASPIGRARKTSDAIAQGCSIAVSDDTGTTYASRVASVPAPTEALEATVLLDAGLSERHFGKAEGTRQGKPVDGFPCVTKERGDTQASFTKRVALASQKWIQWLVAYAAHCAGQQSSTFEKRARSDDDNVPHLVLVSHGQWINAFLSIHAPHLRRGADAFYIRSENTGLFTLAVHLDETKTPYLRVIKQNETSHLDGLLPPRKKARGAQSTTLTTLWHPAPRGNMQGEQTRK